MNVNYLSCNVSALENLRRLAEHNAQTTENYASIQQKFLNSPAEEVRDRCKVAIVGIIGLAAIITLSSSLAIGSLVVLAVVIPVGIARNCAAKINKLTLQLVDEAESNVKFIYTEIGVIFGKALTQRSNDLVKCWNDGTVVDLTTIKKSKIDKTISKQMDEMIAEYNENISIILHHQNAEFPVKYTRLITYAHILSSTLPKGKKNPIKLFLHPNNFMNDLQRLCSIFVTKCEPKMKTNDCEPDEDEENADSLKKHELSNGRNFYYFDYSVKKLQTTHLKECYPLFN